MYTLIPSRGFRELKLSGGGGGVGAQWGLGWALASSPQVRSGHSQSDLCHSGRPGVGARLGDLLSAQAFGHTGSVGSLAWADPVSEMLCVICSDRNVQSGHLRRRVSNLVAASVLVGAEAHRAFVWGLGGGASRSRM